MLTREERKPVGLLLIINKVIDKDRKPGCGGAVMGTVSEHKDSKGK